jgi:hypothetical protein
VFFLVKTISIFDLLFINEIKITKILLLIKTKYLEIILRSNFFVSFNDVFLAYSLSLSFTTTNKLFEAMLNFDDVFVVELK